MTFPTHGLSGGVLHALIGKLLLWIVALLIGIVGLSVPVWFSAVVMYLFFTSGLYLGAFADTEDWIASEVTFTAERWKVYDECHSGGMVYLKYRWIPAWWWHVFCDKFAHPPADIATPARWYQMDERWKSKDLLFGFTLWDLQYFAREGWLLTSTVIVAWMGGLL